MAALFEKFVVSSAFGTPFGGRGGRKGSAIVPFERAIVVSYRLSIVTIALSLTIQPQFSIECLTQIWGGRGWPM